VVRLTIRPPTANVPVVFLDADDNMVATVMTDAAGQAQATMAAGGSVTVIAGDGGPPAGLPSTSLVTFLATKPGDELTPARATPAERHPPGHRPDLGRRLVVRGADLVRRRRHRRHPNPDDEPCRALARPRSWSGPRSARGSSRFTPASTSPATPDPITVTGTYRSPTAVDVTVRGLPASVTLAEVRTSRIADSVVINSGGFGDVPSGGVLTAPDVEVDDLPGLDLGTSALLSRPAGGPARELQALYDRRAFTDAVELDAGPTLLPWIAATAIDVKVSRLTWLAQGSGSGDLVLAVAQLVGRTAGLRRWVVIGAGRRHVAAAAAAAGAVRRARGRARRHHQRRDHGDAGWPG
jgi:hypothetical protein